VSEHSDDSSPWDIARRWGPRIGFSVADQGIGSGANFIAALMLARWLSVADYGLYAIAGAFNLYLMSLYADLMPEPMSVLGASEYRSASLSYYRTLLRLHMRMSLLLVTTACLAFPLLRLWNPAIAWACLAASASAPFTFLYWLCRRACYFHANAPAAARGSAVYATVSLGLLFAAGRSHASVGIAYAVAAGGSLAATIVLHRRLRLDLRDEDSTRTDVDTKSVSRRHLQYLRLALISSGAQALGPLALSPALAAAAGFGAAGVLRAAQNLAVPVTQVMVAVSILFLPWSASRLTQGGVEALLRTTRRSSLLLLALTVPYAALAASFGHQLMALAYHQDAYASEHEVLYLLLPAALLGAIAHPCALALRAAQRPGDLLVIKLASAAVALAVCLPIIVRFGLIGAAWSVLIMAITEAALMASMLGRYVRRARAAH
jgi:O-antigen/teichoic acid export membrane protein